MNREEYMAALEKHLRKLPRDERENALVYYNEYFDDAEPENEDRVIGELGSPAKLAAQLRSEYALKGNEQEKKKMPVVLIVILSIFAAPIALPLVIVAIRADGRGFQRPVRLCGDSGSSGFGRLSLDGDRADSDLPEPGSHPVLCGQRRLCPRAWDSAGRGHVPAHPLGHQRL